MGAARGDDRTRRPYAPPKCPDPAGRNPGIAAQPPLASRPWQRLTQRARHSVRRPRLPLRSRPATPELIAAHRGLKAAGNPYSYSTYSRLAGPGPAKTTGTAASRILSTSCAPARQDVGSIGPQTTTMGDNPGAVRPPLAPPGLTVGCSCGSNDPRD